MIKQPKVRDVTWVGATGYFSLQRAIRQADRSYFVSGEYKLEWYCSRPGQRIKPGLRWFKPGQRCTNFKPKQQLLNQGSEPPLDDIFIFGLTWNSSPKPGTVGLNRDYTRIHSRFVCGCLVQSGRHFRCSNMTSSLFHHQPWVRIEIWRAKEGFLLALIMPVLGLPSVYF